jgi:hypothetical protein
VSEDDDVPSGVPLLVELLLGSGKEWVCAALSRGAGSVSVWKGEGGESAEEKKRVRKEKESCKRIKKGVSDGRGGGPWGFNDFRRVD